MTELAALVEKLLQLPLPALMLLVLIGGYRGWWVYGSTHRTILEEVRADRDEWKRIALDVSGLAASVVKHIDARAAEGVARNDSSRAG